MGFDGKTLIHPSQLAAANEIFAPADADVEQAKAVIEAFADPTNAGKGVLKVNGKMTELLHLEEAKRTVDVAAAAGWEVSVLSNDLYVFHGREWAAGIPLLRQVDRVIDCSDGPALKPDPRAYEWALDQLGVSAGDVLFVDDQPANVEAARSCGIETVWFDVAHAEECWDGIAARVAQETAS